MHSHGTPTEICETQTISNVSDIKIKPDISLNANTSAEGTELKNMWNGEYAKYPADFVTAADGGIIEVENINATGVTKVEYYTWSGGDTKSQINGGTWSTVDGTGKGWKVAYEGSGIALNSLYMRMSDNASFIKSRCHSD